MKILVSTTNQLLTPHVGTLLKKKQQTIWHGGTNKGAESVHQLVIHLYIAKQPLFNNLHAAIPPLDGPTLPESRQEIEFFS